MLIGTATLITTMTYPIGTSGVPWGDAEKAQWLSRQGRRRSYTDAVMMPVERLSSRFDVEQYGELCYGHDCYPLFALRTRNWSTDKPIMLITGGVHGYETSGVHGALLFADTKAEQYADRVNLLIVPCVSPWGYERIHRWNAHAVDPNRSFRENSPAEEASTLMRYIAPMRERILVHIDLHETTDTDETEFRPALAARDGKPFESCSIPDGFYLVANSGNPQLSFQQAIIDAVAKVTHIADPDTNGQLIGLRTISRGVIQLPMRQLGLCGAMTDARYATTTEVYPDSPRTTPEQCNTAQVAAVCTGIEFALTKSIP
jgi:Zinc carboxypeptidase